MKNHMFYQILFYQKEKEFDDILLETLQKYLGRTVKSLKKEFPDYRDGYSHKHGIIKQIYKSGCDLEKRMSFKKPIIN